VFVAIHLGLSLFPFPRFGQFFVEKRTFFTTSPFNPTFDNVPLALHPPNVVRGEPWHMVNYSYIFFFPTTPSSNA